MDKKIILSVPSFHWVLCLIGFAVHLLMKGWGKANAKKKPFATKQMGISLLHHYSSLGYAHGVQLLLCRVTAAFVRVGETGI